LNLMEATKTMNVEKAGKPIEVLIVEDNHGEDWLIQRMLEKARGTSFHISRADRVSTAMKSLAGGNIDVVIVDLRLPDSQGLDTLARIKSQASDVPVIVLLGLEDESLANVVMYVGAQDYLIKGQVDSDLLVHSLHHAIQRKRLEYALGESWGNQQRSPRPI
jgi:two-component system cell cycle sensor histidine kinase/response regulator CckA